MCTVPSVERLGEVGGPEARPLLETATQLGRRDGGHWTVGLLPGAGEAGGSFRYSGRIREGQGEPRDPDPARSAAEAARRARTRLRRYCAANRLNRLGTLTYAGAGIHDPVKARGDIATFFRSLRSGIGGRPLPYAWVPEWHPGGHGLHFHFAVGRFIKRSHIESAWGHGFVHIKLLGDLPVGSGALEEARRAARYLSKYVAKGMDGDDLGGLHRYDVAQGFQPEVERIVAPTADEAIEIASERMGSAPSITWQSRQEVEWHGPPARWVQWNG